MHLLQYVVKCTDTDSPFITQASCSKCPPSAWIHFPTRVTRELVTLRSTVALLMFLATLRIRWNSSSLVLTLWAHTTAWRKYHLSHVAEKCTDQSVGYQWHQITRLQQRDAGSCFRQFRVGYHDPINGSFFFVDSIAGKMGHVSEQNVTNQRQLLARWTASTLR